MRLMTRTAVSVQDRFVGIRPQELRLRILMTRVTDAIHSVFQDMLYVRPVGVMARAALSLGKRHMGVFRFFIPGFCVARKTERGVFCIE